MNRAVVGQRVARLPFQAEDDGASPIPRLHFETATTVEVNSLLVNEHYLGPSRAGQYCYAGWLNDELVAAMVFRWPTARHLPCDGTWLELSRWCLTSDAGKNAGSRMMGWVARHLRRHSPRVDLLVSYSDPSQGHTGALYRASGWVWAPTWHRLSPPPTGNGSWNGRDHQSVKDRWLFALTPAGSALVENKAGATESSQSVRRLLSSASLAEPGS